MCRGVDKSLARPGRKEAGKHVRDARDFNDIETRTVIKFFFPVRQGVEANSCHSDRNISFFLLGQSKYLSAPLYIHIYMYMCVCFICPRSYLPTDFTTAEAALGCL